MMTIYSATTTSFTDLGYGVLKDYKTNPLITETLNGIYNLEFDYAKNGILSEYLEETNIIKCNGQAFRICNIKKNMNSISVLAKHIIFDLKNNFVEDVAPTNLTSQGALNWVLNRAVLNHNFVVNGDCVEKNSARYVRKNIIDTIYNEDNSILNRFGGEIEVNNYNIFIHNKRGQDKGFSIRYGKNLTGIDFNLDFSSVVTKIMPQGKDELLIDEKYVNSPKINDYYMPFIKKIDFDIGVDDETTEEEAKIKLINECQKLFDSGIDIPKISIKVNFIELSKCREYEKYSNLESCSLGDTIKIIIPELEINTSIRIIKTIYDDALGRFVEMELGNEIDNIVTTTSKITNNLENKINSNNDSVLEQAKNNAKNLINHPFNGNILIDKNSGEIYLMDTNDPATATYVWKWSLGGLGFSSTGINGEYDLALTQNNGIVADFITSGTMSTERIDGLNEIISDTLNIKIAPIFKNIDENTGDINAIKTINGYTFNNDGLNISTSQDTFNTLINTIGTYYKDGETIVSQTTKDGTITKDMVLYGEYFYGVDKSLDVNDFKREDAMFVAELFEDENGEEGFGHFYNKGE